MYLAAKDFKLFRKVKIRICKFERYCLARFDQLESDANGLDQDRTLTAKYFKFFKLMLDF